MTGFRSFIWLPVDSLAKRPIGVLQRALVRRRKSQRFGCFSPSQRWSLLSSWERRGGEGGMSWSFSGGDSASRGRRDRRRVVGASKREACYTDKAEAMPFVSAFTALICPCILFPDLPATHGEEVWDNSGRWGSTRGGKRERRSKNTGKDKTRWKEKTTKDKRWMCLQCLRRETDGVAGVGIGRRRGLLWLYLERVCDWKDATKEDWAVCCHAAAAGVCEGAEGRCTPHPGRTSSDPLLLFSGAQSCTVPRTCTCLLWQHSFKTLTCSCVWKRATNITSCVDLYTYAKNQC